MKIRTRILVQTLSAFFALTVVLGVVFFVSVERIRNTVSVNSIDLVESVADLSAYSLEKQLIEKIDHIARNTALALDSHARMGGEVSLDDFAQIIDSAGMGNMDQIFILNRDGVMIYASNGIEMMLGEAGIEGINFLESQNPRLRSLGMSMTLGASGMSELEIDGLPVYVAYVPVLSPRWSLGVTVPAQEISASVSLIGNQIWRITGDTISSMDRNILLMAGFIAVILLLTLCGIVVFAIRFTRAVTGPILALNAGVHEVAGGNLERSVDIKTGDELEQLAGSFNMMTAQLRRHIEEIAANAAKQQRIDTELEIATQIQMSMLPNDFPPFTGRKNEFELYAEVHPAREVGGDFYDFFFIDDDHFAIVIADVSGKGIPAALFMAITKTIIKNHLQGGDDPALALEIINRKLCDNNNTDMFITVWLCVLEISSGKLVYVNAGHNSPLFRRAGNAGKPCNKPFTFFVSPPDLVLAGISDTRYHSHEIRLESGDMLFLYTDGIVEAMGPGDSFYGKERMRAFLNGNAAMPLREMLPLLRSDIAEFSAGTEQSDDITMLALRICPKTSPLQSITLRTNIDQLETLNGFIGRALESAGCPQRIHSHIELAAEEIFVNIANYSNAEEMSVECNVEHSLLEAPLHEKGEWMTMTLIFRDCGSPFNPLEYSAGTKTPPENWEPGGVGLLIVRKITDTIHYCYKNGVNCLKITKLWQKGGL